MTAVNVLPLMVASTELCWLSTRIVLSGGPSKVPVTIKSEETLIPAPLAGLVITRAVAEFTEIDTGAEVPTAPWLSMAFAVSV